MNSKTKIKKFFSVGGLVAYRIILITSLLIILVQSYK